LAGYGSIDLIPSGQEEKTEAVKALNGEIIPFEIDLNQSFRVCLSPQIDWFNYSIEDLSKGIELRSVLYDKIATDQFKIQFIDNRLMVSATIRDSNKNIIAQIVNNTWKTVDPSYQLAFWDRNYNAYAFEIIGSNYIPTFQVIMFGPNKIQIGGLFYLEGGGSIYITPLKNGDAVIYVNPPNEHREENETITTIFNYPCMTKPENLGKMVDPIYPSDDPLAAANSKIQIGYSLFYGGSVLAAFSLTIFSLAIAALFEKRKPQAKPTTIIQHHYNYYLDRKRKKRKRKKRE